MICFMHADHKSIALLSPTTTSSLKPTQNDFPLSPLTYLSACWLLGDAFLRCEHKLYPADAKQKEKNFPALCLKECG